MRGRLVDADFSKSVNDLVYRVAADVYSDPLATVHLSGENGGTAPTERVEYKVALIGACGDDAIEKGKGFCVR